MVISNLALLCGATSATLSFALLIASVMLLSELKSNSSFDILKQIVKLFVVRCSTGFAIGVLIATA